MLPAVQFKSQSPFPDDPSKVQEPKTLSYSDIEDAQEASRNFDSLDNYPNRAEDFDPLKQARIAERRGQKPKGKFQGKKVSGNTVSSVTPDAPKGVTSDAGFDLRKAVSDNVAKGMDANRALKIAKLEERLAKVKGKGKGKGKLLTTLGAVDICFLANSLTTTNAAPAPDIAANCTALASTPTSGATVNAPMKASINVQTVLFNIPFNSSLIL